MESEGWRPLLSESAQSFLDAPLLTSPCCLVLDVNMPGLNGLDLQSKIIVSRSRMHICLRLWRRSETVKALKGGVLDFLTKPIDTMALLDAVRSALAQ